MRELPPQIVERMKTMTPAQQQEVIDYYRRNDEEEVRLKAKAGMLTTPVEAVKAPLYEDIPETIKRPTPTTTPTTEIPETIKNPLNKYVDEVFTEATKNRKGLSYVLETEAKQRGLEKEDLTRLTDWMSKVAEIESNNIPDRKQGDKEDGIGRGKYQFEIKRGKLGAGTAQTARNRFNNWEEQNGALDIPKADRKELEKEMPDFSKLSEQTQDILFVIHHSKHQRTPLTKIAKGSVSFKDAWADYHWAGNAKDKPAKLTMWDARFDEGNYKAKLANLANTFLGAV